MSPTPLEDFKSAVSRRDAAALRQVLERDPDARRAIDAPIFSFDSPALVAVAGDAADVVEVLLDFGADPNRRSGWWAGGFHPLHVANPAAAARLLAAGAVPDACAAAHLDDRELLSRLLAEDPARVNERGGDGKTPLHFARSRRAADLLLDAGADVDARDVDHRSTPAEWMIGEADRRDLARYLVERGASVDVFLAAALGLTERARAIVDKDPSSLSARTSHGEYAAKPPSSDHVYQWTIGPDYTPLQVAAKFGHERTLRAMLDLASPEQRLLLACHLGRADEARAILGAHPGIVDELGPDDRRALTEEAWRANAPAVALMLELGFDPSAPSASGAGGGTALHCAAWEGSVACVSALLGHPRGRVLVETRDASYDGTPLGWCCHGSVHCGNADADHAEVARLLVEAGARAHPQVRGCSKAVEEVLDSVRKATGRE